MSPGLSSAAPFEALRLTESDGPSGIGGRGQQGHSDIAAKERLDVVAGLALAWALDPRDGIAIVFDPVADLDGVAPPRQNTISGSGPPCSTWGRLTFQNSPGLRGRGTRSSSTRFASRADCYQSSGLPGTMYWDRAMAGTPENAASRAAATVPEMKVSPPRFTPALMPERTSSAPCAR